MLKDVDEIGHELTFECTWRLTGGTWWDEVCCREGRVGRFCSGGDGEGGFR